jgi:hypothetical protein
MAKHFKFVSNIATDKINNAVMLEVECSKVGGGFCGDMDVKGFPTVVLVYKNQMMKYPGARLHPAMTEFLGDKSKWVMEDLPTKIPKFVPVAAIADADVMSTEEDIAVTKPSLPAPLAPNEEL